MCICGIRRTGASLRRARWIFLTVAILVPRFLAAQADRPLVLVVGFDGFRRSYVDHDSLPSLHALAAGGVLADAMIPAFPSVTFPNWYAMATGLYPEHSGIVNNTFYDPALHAGFKYSDSTGRQARWYGGEPIWNTATRQGHRVGTMFWVGSDAGVGGTTPTYWRPYDRHVSFEDRIAQVFQWIDLPAGQRPDLVMMYFEEPDHTGHEWGPDGPQTAAAAARVDSMLGKLVDGLKSRGLFDRVNLVVLADHGMAQTAPDRLIYLSDVVDSNAVRVVSLSPLLMIAPRDGDVPGLEDRLSRLPHLSVWRREAMPARFHYGDNARITPLVGLVDVGWTLEASRKDTLRGRGNHGYDNGDPSMAALFLAHGPAFRAGAHLAPFPNVDVYDLIARLVGVQPAANDGTLDVFSGVLTR